MGRGAKESADGLSSREVTIVALMMVLWAVAADGSTKTSENDDRISFVSSNTYALRFAVEEEPLRRSTRVRRLGLHSFGWWWWWWRGGRGRRCVQSVAELL